MICCNEAVIGQDHNLDAEPAFHFCDGVALMVQDVKRNITVHGDVKLIHLAFQGFFLNRPDQLQCSCFYRSHATCAFTMWTGAGDGFVEAQPQSLPGHFQQAEMADRPNLNAGAIVPHGILHATLDSILILVFFHVDEVDNNQAREVAKTELACQLICSFQIGLQGCFFDVALSR